MADKLTPQQKHDARLVLEGKIEGQAACIHCGGIHLRACRRVKRAEWHPDGSLLRVVYWADGKWDESEIIFPEAAYESDSDEKEA